MRGKVCFSVVGDKNARITPAYAGKSIFLCIVLYLVWDHPRVCGEKLSFD